MNDFFDSLKEIKKESLDSFGKAKRNFLLSLKDAKTTWKKDINFKKEYENIQPEMDVIRAIVDAGTAQNLTQKELSKRTSNKNKNDL